MSPEPREDGLNQIDSPIAAREFNIALSRIPINFIGNGEILQKYKELRFGLTGDKFHALITAMLKDAGQEIPIGFDVDLLSTILTRNTALKT